MKKRFRITLQVKIILIFIILISLLVSGLSIVLIKDYEAKKRREIEAIEPRLIEQLRQKGEPLARQIALITETAIAEFNYSLVQELVAAVVHDDEVLYGVVISKTGELLANSGNFQTPDDEQLADEFTAAPEESNQIVIREYQHEDVEILEIAVPLFDIGEYWGSVRLGMSLEGLKQGLQQAEDQMNQDIADTWNTAFVMMAVFGLLGIIAAVLVSHQLTIPIQQVVTGANLIAKGNFDHHVAVSSHDEIGDLARSFNQMISSLHETVQIATAISRGDLDTEVVLRSERDTLSTAFKTMSAYLREMADIAIRISEGDLTVNVIPVSEQDILGSAFQKMVGHLVKFIAEIREGTDQIAKEAEAMTTAADQMARTTLDNQAQAHEVSQAAGLARKNVTTVATAIEEMTATIIEIARNISDTGSMVRHANNEAQSTQVVIQDLAEASTKISEISQLIASIAGQTNLLALNATIEAARAGESGKGFAVVAGEVKELARQTGSAITEIDEIVQTIQEMATRATEAVARIVDVIQRVAETFESVAVAVEEQTATTSEINKTTQEANRQVSEMVRMNEAIETAERQIAQGAERVKDSALTLNILSGELYRLLKEFRLDKG